MSENNLALWKRLAQPPADALKKISGGRLSGMTDINPQYRAEALSAEFGPVGFGWKYTIDKMWTEPGPDNQVFAFANISLYVKRDGEWSDAIVGSGGNMLIEKESKGLHANDEAWKMTLTDALGNAAKYLGLGAYVYRNRWDGKEFRQPLPERQPPQSARAAFGGQPAQRPPQSPKPAAAPKPQQSPPPQATPVPPPAAPAPAVPPPPASPPPPAVETWENMSYPRRTEYTLNAIAKAMEEPDPVKCRTKLKKIFDSPKLKQLDQAGQDAVAGALRDGEAKLDREAAAATKGTAA
jgi:hypothetical protein